MVRGGRGFGPRGSFRGSSRGGGGGGGWNSSRPSGSSGWAPSRPSAGPSFGSTSRDSYSSFNSFDKGRFNDRFSRDEGFSKPYREDFGRDSRIHSPDRKRFKPEGPPRHDYGNRYEPSYVLERRNNFSDDRERHVPHSNPYSTRRDEFHKPISASPSAYTGRGGGSVRGRSSRGFRSDRGSGGGPPQGRRLADKSYTISRRGGGSVRTRSNFASRYKTNRPRSTIQRRRPIQDHPDIDSDHESDDEEEIEEETTEVEVKKEPVEEDKVEDVATAELKEVEKVEPKEEDTTTVATSEDKSKVTKAKTTTEKLFVKLVCPHCDVKVPTFRFYEEHLSSRSHSFMMRKVAAKQRSILIQMRQAQRNSQNELEKSGEGITEHTVFCPVCKLNYKQERAVHQATAAHKNMKKFLLPSCKLCKESFKSPMTYEHHLCSIRHLKRKSAPGKAPTAADDNLEELTTIDSIDNVEETAAPDAEAKQATESAKKKKKEKKDVSVGIEQIKKIEAYYCNLCRMFLPRGTENEYPEILAGHCRKRFHMQRYIRQREIDTLKKKAEKLQQKETEEKQVEEPTVEPLAAEPATIQDIDISKSMDDDKLWDAVDKDLGELLEETDDRDEDDEEGADGGRYDKFRRTDTNGEEENNAAPAAETVGVKQADA